MPAYRVCQKFFLDALSLFHKYGQKVLLDAIVETLSTIRPRKISVEELLSSASNMTNFDNTSTIRVFYLKENGELLTVLLHQNPQVYQINMPAA